MAKKGGRIRKTKAQLVSKEDFLEKLEEKHGNIYAAYTELGLYWKIINDWRDSDPDFEAAVVKIQKSGVTYAENKLWELIDKGDGKLLKFYLACKGGYSEKKTIELDSRSVIDVQSAIDSIKAELEAD